MAVLARVNWLREQALKGCVMTVHMSHQNMKDKLRFLLAPMGASPSGPSSPMILGALGMIASATLTHVVLHTLRFSGRALT